MSAYFTNPTDSIHHSGASTSIFKNGDTQTQVNEKLAAAIEKLVQNNGCVSTGNAEITTLNTDLLTNKSRFGATDSFVSSPYQVRVDSKAKESGTNIFYDINPVLGGTDKLLYSRIVVEAKNGVVVDTDKISSSFTLAPENFPASISIDLRKETADGNIEYLSTKAQLSPVDTTAPVTVFKRELGGTELKTQTDVNNFLKERLDNLQKSVPSSIDYSGEKVSLQETVNRLLIEIAELKSKVGS